MPLFSRSFLVLAALFASVPATRCLAADEPKPVDACALVTKAEAEQLLGKPVRDPDHPLEGTATYAVTSCTYRATEGMERVSIVAIAASDAASARSAFDLEKNQAVTQMNVTPVDVAGLGDAAFWEGGIYNKLRVLSGRVGLSIGITGQTTPDGKLRTAAETAIKRLR